MEPSSKLVDKKELSDRYKKIRPLYVALIEEISSILLKATEEKSIAIRSIQSRIKTIESIYQKVIHLGIEDNPFLRITDIAGIRIVCTSEQDMDIVGQLISERLQIVDKMENKTLLETAGFAYMPHHFVVRIPKNLKGSRYDKIRQLNCEIQTTTEWMDAWNFILRDLDYKKANVPSDRVRFLLNALFWYQSNRHPSELTSLKKKLDKHHSALEIYKGLIADKSDEPTFQRFFERNPQFLEPRVTKTFPKKTFAGENVPDFVLSLGDDNYILVEIEKPTARLYTKNGDPTAELSHAEEQIRRYLRWAKEEKEFLRKRGLTNLSVENVMGLVVIGANLTAEEKLRLENHNSIVRANYIIKPFDKILQENQLIFGNPV